ncbi:MAG TPA: hypothetical protein DCE41_04615 [Cytophagales bacterium]|nr:hypothetical protein [Cytophagales bacterium]
MNRKSPQHDRNFIHLLLTALLFMALCSGCALATVQHAPHPAPRMEATLEDLPVGSVVTTIPTKPVRQWQAGRHTHLRVIMISNFGELGWWPKTGRVYPEIIPPTATGIVPTDSLVLPFVFTPQKDTTL